MSRRVSPIGLWFSHVGALLFVVAAVPALVHSQSGAVAPWSGFIECQLDVQEPGYRRHETQTWRLTGQELPSNGDIRMYAARWTYSGSGQFERVDGTSASVARWTISAPAADAPLAVFVRNGRLLIRPAHAQRTVADALIGTRQITTKGAPGAPTAIALALDEWPLPSLETDPGISASGTFTVQTRGLGGALPGSPAPAICRYQFSHPGASPQASQSAATAAAGSGTNPFASNNPPGSSAQPGTATTAPAPPPPSTGGGTATVARDPGTMVVRAGTTPSSATEPANPPATPVAVGCDADTPSTACVLSPMIPGLNQSASGNFHIASDISDWYAVTAYVTAPTAPFAALDVSLTGGMPDGQYAIEISEGPLSNPVVLGVAKAAHAPKTTVGWSSAASPSKSLLIKVSHIAGASGNDPYSLQLSLSETVTAPVSAIPVSPAVLAGTIARGPTPATSTSSPTSAQSQQVPSQGAPVAIGCDADARTSACVLGPMTPRVTQTALGNFHVATDVSDWYSVSLSTPASSGPYALFAASLTGGTADGQYAIDLYESASSASAVATSGTAHAPSVTVSWSTAALTTRNVLIEVHHIGGASGNEPYTLMLSLMPADAPPPVAIPDLRR